MELYCNVYCMLVMVCVMENQVFVVVVNCVGGGSYDVVFVGGSFVVDLFGNLIFEVGNIELWYVIEFDFDQFVVLWVVYDYCWDQCLQIVGECIVYVDGCCELLIL